MMQNAIAIGLSVFFLTDTASAPLGASCGSATCYRSAEDVRIVPIVIPKLKFRNVERQILLGDVVERAEDAAFQQRPEPVNGLGVHVAPDVFAAHVVRGAMLEPLLGQAGIQAAFVGSDQIDLLGNSFADEGVGNANVHTVQSAGDQGAPAAHGTNDRELVGHAATLHLVGGMPVLVLAANVGLVHLYNAHQLAELRVNQSGPDAHAEVMGGAVAAEAHDALDLKSGDPLLAGLHHVDDLEAVPQADIRVLEHGPAQHREAVAGAAAPTACQWNGRAFRCDSLSLPQRGDRTPSGQWRATRSALQASSVGNRWSNWPDVIR